MRFELFKAMGSVPIKINCRGILYELLKHFNDDMDVVDIRRVSGQHSGDGEAGLYKSYKGLLATSDG